MDLRLVDLGLNSDDARIDHVLVTLHNGNGQNPDSFIQAQFETRGYAVKNSCTRHWWREVILRPAKSNAKSLFTCQNLAPTFGRVSNWEKFPN